MSDTMSTETQATSLMGNKAIAVSTVGYMCIAITWWMTGMLMAGWFTPATTNAPDISTGTMYALGSALLIIIGILSLIYGKRALDSIVFLSTAGLFFSLHSAQMTTITGGAISGYMGWYALVWAVFFCYVWVSSLIHGTGTIRMLFLLLFWLGALAAAIGGWTGSHGFDVLCGYLLLVTAILSFIVSAADILGHDPDAILSSKMKLPVNPSVQPHPAA